MNGQTLQAPPEVVRMIGTQFANCLRSQVVIFQKSREFTAGNPTDVEM